MTAYVYVKSEPQLFTVGFYDPSGEWHPDSDHDDRESAAARVAYLNGGPVPVTPEPSPQWHVLKVWNRAREDAPSLYWLHVEEDDAAFMDGVEDRHGSPAELTWITEETAEYMIATHAAYRRRGRSRTGASS